MRDGLIFQKNPAPISYMTTFRINLISAGSISLDSTFNRQNYGTFFQIFFVLVEKLSPADLLGLLKGRGQRDPEITTALIREVAHPLVHKTIDSSLRYQVTVGNHRKENQRFGFVFILSGSSILC